MSNMKIAAMIADANKEQDHRLLIAIAEGSAVVMAQTLKPMQMRLAQLEARIAFLEAGATPANADS
jgi:hypothetical protein